jgi:hypothetical protein
MPEQTLNFDPSFGRINAEFGKLTPKAGGGKMNVVHCVMSKFMMTMDASSKQACGHMRM